MDVKKYIQLSITIIFILISFTFLYSAESTDSSNITIDIYREPQLTNVYKMIENGNYLEAVITLREIMNKSSDIDFNVNLGKLISNIFITYLKDYNSAIKEIKKTLKMTNDPQDKAELYYMIATIYWNTGNKEDACNQFEIISEKFEESIWKYNSDMMLLLCEKIDNNENYTLDTELFNLEDQFLIRILLFKDKKVTISSEKEIHVFSSNNTLLYSSYKSVLLLASGSSIILDGGRVDSKEPILIATLENSLLKLKNKKYKGVIQIYNQDGILMVINIVGLEDYLKGVLPKEMPPNWNFEALKAQAVASRTYAVYQILSRKNQLYDVDSTFLSQVYGGYDSNNKSTNKAIDATKGEILLYNGEPIISYFHSNSGGYIESAESVWGMRFPYLKGIPDIYSNGIGDDTWELALDSNELTTCLFKRSKKIGEIYDIKITERSPSGRVKKLDIYHSYGVESIDGLTFRMAIGATRLKSTLFKIYKKEDIFIFRGKGYGHGVGMSQWGALQMANLGKSYRDILRFYYPGTKIGKQR